MRTSVLGLALILLFSDACGGTQGKQGGAKGEGPPGAARTSEPVRVAEGQRAPSFDVRDVDGVARGIAPGKVNVLMFWATWSSADKVAMPRIQELFARHAPRGLAVLGLSMDDEGRDIAEAARSWGARFPVAWDANQTIARAYQVPNTPVFYVIDRSGVIRFIHIGYRDHDEKVIEREVQKLLGR